MYPMNQEVVQSILQNAQAKHILEFIANCKKDLNHYTKLKRRYSVANNIVKYSSYGILTTSEVGGIILVVLGTSGIMIPIIIGASGFFETLISALISEGILNRKKNIIQIFVTR